MTGKGRLLRDRMADSGLVHVMAAHSPLSARLAQEAGFDGIWASGFELSALYGLADVSLISMTQHLDMLRAMAERVDLPIVAVRRGRFASLAEARAGCDQLQADLAPLGQFAGYVV